MHMKGSHCVATLITSDKVKSFKEEMITPIGTAIFGQILVEILPSYQNPDVYRLIECA